MVNRGDIIISKNDLVTPEKYKVLESFRIEHEQTLGSTIDRVRSSVAQTVLTLIAIHEFLHLPLCLPETAILQQQGFLFPV